MLKRSLTKISVTGFAKLPPTSEAKVKRKLIRSPELAAILNGSEGIFCVVVSDKAIVVPENEDTKIVNVNMWT